jgi:hypothetical protein
MAQDNVLIKSETDLRKFVRDVLKESDRASLYNQSLREKENQNVQAAAATPAPEPAAKEQPTEQPSATQSTDDDADAMKKGDIKFEDIADKLNTIRSGKSFKDAEVAASMQRYIESLSSAERTALFAFLKGIAQIVTGEIPADKATEPADAPSDVSMQKKGEEGKKTVVIKPTVIKGVPSSKKPEEKQEDSTGPAPIAPKRR